MIFAYYCVYLILSNPVMSGLVMAKEIIDLHGGEVLFKSELGGSGVPLCAVVWCTVLRSTVLWCVALCKVQCCSVVSSAVVWCVVYSAVL
jgi:hypothetical protein